MGDDLVPLVSLLKLYGLSGYGAAKGSSGLPFPEEIVAEIISQFILHDQYLPYDEWTPAVQEFIKKFGLPWASN